MPDTIEWRHWYAVNTVLQSYADAFDRADLPAVLALFAPDAVWDHGVDHLRRGREAIGAFLAERFTVYAGTSHHIGPPLVTRNADGLFESVAYLVATHLLHEGRTYTGYGRYCSTLQETETGMLITRHNVVAHVTIGVSAPVSQLARVIRHPS